MWKGVEIASLPDWVRRFYGTPQFSPKPELPAQLVDVRDSPPAAPDVAGEIVINFPAEPVEAPSVQAVLSDAHDDVVDDLSSEVPCKCESLQWYTIRLFCMASVLLLVWHWKELASVVDYVVGLLTGGGFGLVSFVYDVRTLYHTYVTTGVAHLVNWYRLGYRYAFGSPVGVRMLTPHACFECGVYRLVVLFYDYLAIVIACLLVFRSHLWFYRCLPCAVTHVANKHKCNRQMLAHATYLMFLTGRSVDRFKELKLKLTAWIKAKKELDWSDTKVVYEVVSVMSAVQEMSSYEETWMVGLTTHLPLLQKLHGFATSGKITSGKALPTR
jgi:hypothetical protein